jgi:hypothetical protein
MDTMSDLIHKCLTCNEICYEVEADFSDEEEKHKVYALYKCPNCGFMWEVITCGERFV